MKTLFASAAALCTVGLMTAVSADTVLDIDDDGFKFVPAPAPVGYTVDIDDDGWTRLPVEIRSNRGGAPSECSPLEATVGVAQAECGTIDRSELVRMKFDADSND